jgi:hypothetical protein
MRKVVFVIMVALLVLLFPACSTPTVVPATTIKLPTITATATVSGPTVTILQPTILPVTFPVMTAYVDRPVTTTATATVTQPPVTQTIIPPPVTVTSTITTTATVTATPPTTTTTPPPTNTLTAQQALVVNLTALGGSQTFSVTSSPVLLALVVSNPSTQTFNNVSFGVTIITSNGASVGLTNVNGLTPIWQPLSALSQLHTFQSIPGITVIAGAFYTTYLSCSFSSVGGGQEAQVSVVVL